MSNLTMENQGNVFSRGIENVKDFTMEHADIIGSTALSIVSCFAVFNLGRMYQDSIWKDRIIINLVKQVNTLQSK